MSTPVVTDKWAGNFDCDFCRRKRLVGEEFSKKALEKYRKTGGKLKCKQCVQQQEEQERKEAAAKRAASTAQVDASPQGTLKCKTCDRTLDASHFNKNQWSKGEGKARCHLCVEKSLAEEKQQQENSQAAKLQSAKDNVVKARAGGNAQAILKAESELSALEAEKVTGLKPQRMGRGGGRRARGTGRGSDRGRGGPR